VLQLVSWERATQNASSSVFRILCNWIFMQKFFSEKLWFLRVSPCKPRPTLLNRGPQIWVNLIYIAEGSVLRIMAQAISKNIEPSSFHDTHESPVRNYLPKEDTNAAIFREGLIWRSWDFLHTYILVSYSCTKIFRIPHWAVRILWIFKYRAKINIFYRCGHISWRGHPERLKFSTHIHLSEL
jgi:hypothetical protein